MNILAEGVMEAADGRAHMKDAFRSLNGGLFSGDAGKADVGDILSLCAREGIELLGWADPFFPDPVLPEHIRQALIQAINSGRAVHYTPPVGDAALKEAIAVKLAAYNKLSINPQRNILITPGSDSGLFFALLPFIHPGDEVLVHAPSYPSNFITPGLLGGVAVPVACHAETGFHLPLDEYERCLTPRSRVVLLTHPNNPTSIVYSREELEALADFVIAHDLVLVVDQAFEDFIYDDREFVTPAALPGLGERTVTVFSASKGLGLSGLRVGYLTAGDGIMDALFAAAVNVTGAANSAAQAGALAAFRNDAFLLDYKTIFERRRHLVHSLLNKIPGVHMALPESGFLSWVDVGDLGGAKAVTDYLLRHARVAVNDGSLYGPGGENYIRIVHGCFRDEDKLLAVLNRVRDALANLALTRGITQTD